MSSSFQIKDLCVYHEANNNKEISRHLIDDFS